MQSDEITITLPATVKVRPDGKLLEKPKKWVSTYQSTKTATSSTVKNVGQHVKKGGFFKRGGRFVDGSLMDIEYNPNAVRNVGILIGTINKWTHFGVKDNTEKKRAAIEFVEASLLIAQSSFGPNGRPKEWVALTQLQLKTKTCDKEFDSKKLPDQLWRALFMERRSL